MNGEIHPISPGVTDNLTPNDEHLLALKLAQEANDEVVSSYLVERMTAHRRLHGC